MDDDSTMAVLDGYLEEDPQPGDSLAVTALFRLTLSSTEDPIDEAILPCSVADPQLAHDVLHTLRPGDHLRVTGTIRVPHNAGEALRLCVSAMELLDTAPLRLTEPAEPDTLPGDSPTGPPLLPAGFSLPVDGGRLERYGPYLAYSDPDTTLTSVWRADGTWVGADAYPVTASDLIDAFERRTAAGEP